MALHSRSGLLGFLLLLAALAPSPGGATAVAPPERSGQPAIAADPPPGSVEARLRRLSAALWEQQNGKEAPSPESLSGKARTVAFIWVNGGWPNGFRNGIWRNGGWGNGGWRNGGWPNGFRNGGWPNGWRNGGWRNGGWRNHW